MMVLRPAAMFFSFRNGTCLGGGRNESDNGGSVTLSAHLSRDPLTMGAM